MFNVKISWRSVVLVALCLAGSAWAQTKPRIEKAADLPRFTYKVDGKLEDIVRSPNRFAPLARRSGAIRKACSTTTRFQIARPSAASST